MELILKFKTFQLLEYVRLLTAYSVQSLIFVLIRLTQFVEFRNIAN